MSVEAAGSKRIYRIRRRGWIKWFVCAFAIVWLLWGAPTGFVANRGDDLSMAVSTGQAELVKRLLDRGANPNGKTEATPIERFMWSAFKRPYYVGLHPVAVTVQRDDPVILKLLLDHGADPNARCGPGESIPALYAATSNQQLEIVDLLLSKGANPNITAEAGKTPLYRAAGYGNLELAMLLLKHGADPNFKDSRGVSPLMYAAKCRHKAMVDLLTNPSVITRTK